MTVWWRRKRWSANLIVGEGAPEAEQPFIKQKNRLGRIVRSMVPCVYRTRRRDDPKHVLIIVYSYQGKSICDELGHEVREWSNKRRIHVMSFTDGPVFNRYTNLPRIFTTGGNRFTKRHEQQTVKPNHHETRIRRMTSQNKTGCIHTCKCKSSSILIRSPITYTDSFPTFTMIRCGRCLLVETTSFLHGWTFRKSQIIIFAFFHEMIPLYCSSFEMLPKITTNRTIRNRPEAKRSQSIDYLQEHLIAWLDIKDKTERDKFLNTCFPCFRCTDMINHKQQIFLSWFTIAARYHWSNFVTQIPLQIVEHRLQTFMLKRRKMWKFIGNSCTMSK